MRYFLYKYVSLSRFVRNAFFLNLSRRRILRRNSELNQGLSFGLITTFFLGKLRKMSVNFSHALSTEILSFIIES